MKEFQIYHNPRCSKSRQTLQILQEQGVEPEIVLYLEHPPTPAELKKLIAKLGIRPSELLRRGEADYKDQGLSDPALADTEILAAMHKFPKLIERPIVVCGDRAVLGRPPENVHALL